MRYVTLLIEMPDTPNYNLKAKKLQCLLLYTQWVKDRKIVQ